MTDPKLVRAPTARVATQIVVSILLGGVAPYVAYVLLRPPFVTGNLPERVSRYNAAWDAVPYMRSVLRTTTAVWGIAFLLEVAIRVVLVFHVSTRQALAAGPIIFYAMMLSLIAWTVFYVRRTRPRIEATLDRAGDGFAPADAVSALPD
jgi:hypothetical protein